MKRSRFSDAVLEFGCLQRLAAAPRAALELRGCGGVCVKRGDRNCHWRGDRARRLGRRRGAVAAGDPGGPFGMIPSGVKEFLASHPVDFRKACSGGPPPFFHGSKDTPSDRRAGHTRRALLKAQVDRIIDKK
ncbi:MULTISPECIES: hypothetical protein [unclassified Bradyrhizobium]|uniref:hypothetical protein n=1 Tax=unclassified Bradyrhizobium TaxID=2631580 RepID=UPI0013E143C9|nr:hypothetical protein [Bradyrhizobium sp. 6(2017)]QIG95564.1 hypothetical protein G6P99_26305 [Bradyrhizobium sp. 6(2017)]